VAVVSLIYFYILWCWIKTLIPFEKS